MVKTWESKRKRRSRLDVSSLASIWFCISDRRRDRLDRRRDQESEEVNAIGRKEFEFSFRTVGFIPAVVL